MLSMTECQRRLALLWFTGGGLIFAFMFVQTILGRYRGYDAEAWGWLLPSIMPTLSLIVGVLIAEQSKVNEKQIRVHRFLFRLAFSLSVFYLVLLLLTLLLDPFSQVPLTVVFSLSDVWLGPLQGLVAAALGAFYFRQESSNRSGG